MRWSGCLVYVDDVISFGTDASGGPDAPTGGAGTFEHFFGLQLKAKKCTFMQMEVSFLGHIVGRIGLACNLVKNLCCSGLACAWFG